MSTLASSSGRRLWPVVAAVALVAAAAATGCVRMKEEGDFEELGLVGASSEPPPGLVRPVAPDDLMAVH